MNKIKFLLTSVVTFGGLAFGAGDLEPVDDAMSNDITDNNTAGVYMGAGIGTQAVNFDYHREKFSATTMMLQLGYQYNSYLSAEARYTFGCCTDYDIGSNTNVTAYSGTISSWGMYVKPMYPIDDFSVYALLGYGGVMLSELNNGDAYESGFQWGLGVQYAYTEKMSIFVDYVSVYNDTGFDYVGTAGDVDSATWTIGLSYSF